MDRYSKILLTIVAIALVKIAVAPMTPLTFLSAATAHQKESVNEFSLNKIGSRAVGVGRDGSLITLDPVTGNSVALKIVVVNAK